MSIVAKRICVIALAWANLLAPPAIASADPQYDQLLSAALKRTLTPDEQAQVEHYVAAHKDDPRSHYLLGLVYQRLGYMESATEEYDKAWSKDKKFYDAFFMAAAIKLQGGNKAKDAKSLSAVALQEMQDDFVALTRLATLMQQSGFNDDADKLLARANALHPQSAEMTASLAGKKLADHQYREALDLAERAIAGGATLNGYVAKGEALLAMRRQAEALTAFRQAFKIDQSSPDLNKVYGTLELKMGNNADALPPLLYALGQTTMTKVNVLIKGNLGTALSRVPPEKAQEKINAVAAKLGGSFLGAQMRFALGDVFDRLGRHREAMEQYRQGLVIQPDFARGYFRLGRDYEVYMRDFPTAQSYYERAIRYDGGDAEAKLRSERLSQHVSNMHNDLAMQLKNWWQSSSQK
jgi:tetratricopeptide (TPR) repeat protein